MHTENEGFFVCLPCLATPSLRGASISDKAILGKQGHNENFIITRYEVYDVCIQKIKGFFVWVDLTKFVYKYSIMTTLTMREKLITYMADAKDSKINALYTLLENEIDEDAFAMTGEHYQILMEERAMYLKGEGKSYTPEECIEIAKGLRNF